jgi:uncharacterized membrane protein (DUF106 family)
MSWLLDAVNWVLVTLGDVVQWVWNDGLGSVGALLAFIGKKVNPLLAPLLKWINVVVNAVADVVLAPVGEMPGWLSNTIISAVTGILLLVVFKYTSNQRAIGRVRDDIKANMLALKLFKDELSVTFRSQGRVILGGFRLLRHAIRPLLVMMVPVSLELGQMGLWYQQRPLRPPEEARPGEESLITMKLAGSPEDPMPRVRIVSIPGAEVTIGSVHIRSKREVCWAIRARKSGRHHIVFEVDSQRIEKELVVGEGFMRLSAVRPPWDWTAILLHPLEKPFAVDSPVQSISIDYPSRESWTSGTDWWLVYFFVASLVSALIFKPLLQVRI